MIAVLEWKDGGRVTVVDWRLVPMARRLRHHVAWVAASLHGALHMHRMSLRLILAAAALLTLSRSNQTVRRCYRWSKRRGEAKQHELIGMTGAASLGQDFLHCTSRICNRTRESVQQISESDADA